MTNLKEKYFDAIIRNVLKSCSKYDGDTKITSEFTVIKLQFAAHKVDENSKRFWLIIYCEFFQLQYILYLIFFIIYFLFHLFVSEKILHQSFGSLGGVYNSELNKVKVGDSKQS